jgi:SAM-dependent methyltransferase
VTDVIARKTLPDNYRRWNTRWGAPFGHHWLQWLSVGLRWRRPLRPWVGMFAFQNNNTTRAFEYPWCYFATPLGPGMTALEIGGSLSGFQFVLSKEQLKVVNLDPGESSRGKGWPLTPKAHACLNRALRTDVVLKHCFIEQAHLEDESFDRVFAISVLEHIPPDDLAVLMTHVRRVLKPDGILVATIDLFLDVEPFTREPKNPYGRNVNLFDLFDRHGFQLTTGNPSELYGFPTFVTDDIAVRARKGEFLIGSYPGLVQCLTCRKA